MEALTRRQTGHQPLQLLPSQPQQAEAEATTSTTTTTTTTTMETTTTTEPEPTYPPLDCGGNGFYQVGGYIDLFIHPFIYLLPGWGELLHLHLLPVHHLQGGGDILQCRFLSDCCCCTFHCAGVGGRPGRAGHRGGAGLAQETPRQARGQQHLWVPGELLH